jgi:hypothetical protein
MKVTLYTHSSKESNWDKGKEIGLEDEALKNFMYAGYEHAMEYEVDMATGNAELVAVDGRKLEVKP